jgi:hypothetical protein
LLKTELAQTRTEFMLQNEADSNATAPSNQCHGHCQNNIRRLAENKTFRQLAVK